MEHLEEPADSHSKQGAERYKATQRVTLIGALVNSLLAAAQVIGGILTHSQGLIADGIHTLADLLSDFVVLFAAKHAHTEADSEHPYGHGRIETLATSLLGLMLIAVAAGIAIEVVKRLLDPSLLLQPTPEALFFAALAVLAKETLFRYTVIVAKRIRSSLLEANAWHHRSDAISSLVVIVGIIGTLIGIPAFDAIAALAVSGFIANIGWKLLWQSGQELIDSSLDEEIVKKIEQVIRSVDGVVNMHMLRTRKSGSDAFADVHIQVPGKVSVSEGHQIGEAVRRAILTNIDHVTDITVHIDPEDDFSARKSEKLPSRDELLGRLRRLWLPFEAANQIENINLHYLDGRVDLELIFPGALRNSPEVAEMKKIAEEQAEIRTVKTYFE
ncbi:MAG: cation diffusion facilitator family transporter [Thiotrichales bacterium]